MTKKLVALATAATISFAALAPAAHAQGMGQGFNMLTGAIYVELSQRGLPTENINNLTLSQIAQIKGVLDSDENDDAKNRRILAIMN